MIKNKLRTARLEKGISQEEIADLLGMDQSQYSRREKGVTKISKKEWEKMALILDKNIEEIYEKDSQITINNDNGSSGGFYSNNHYYVADNESLSHINNSDIEKEFLKNRIIELETRLQNLEKKHSS